MYALSVLLAFRLVATDRTRAFHYVLVRLSINNEVAREPLDDVRYIH